MKTLRLASLVLAAALAVACGSARKVPPIASPVQLTEAEEVRGRAEFIEYCHQCHPHGEAGLAPAINDKPLPEFLIKFQVRHGLGAHARVSGGSDQRRGAGGDRGVPRGASRERMSVPPTT